MRIPRARLVTRVDARSNTAHSNIMVWVFSVISLSSPPMMPATQEGLLASQITSWPGVRAWALPSRVVMCSPSTARRTMM